LSDLVLARGSGRPFVTRHVSLTTTLKAALVVVLVGIVVLKWTSAIAFVQERNRGETDDGAFEDYVAFYAAGQLVVQGIGDELYELQSIAQEERAALREVPGEPGGILPYFNPPFVALLLAPLAALTPDQAGEALFAVSVLLTLAVLWLLYRLLPPLDGNGRLLLAGGFLSLTPLVNLALQGQISGFLLLGWTLFIYFQVRGEQRLSGLALALLLIKPQSLLLPFALLVWKRQWQPVIVVSAIAAALVVVSVAVSGPAVLYEYPRFLLESAHWDGKWGIHFEGMFSWTGFLVRSFTPGSAPHLIASGLLIALTVGVVAWVFRGPWRPREPTFLLMSGALLLGDLLINPHLYIHAVGPLPLAVVLGAAYSLRTSGQLGPWGWVAAGVWVVLHFGSRITKDESLDINIVTPAIALVLGLIVWTYFKAKQETSEADMLSLPIDTRTGLRQSQDF
jgi:hypothetical protein